LSYSLRLIRRHLFDVDVTFWNSRTTYTYTSEVSRNKLLTSNSMD
jgi:hypothetical protein